MPYPGVGAPLSAKNTNARVAGSVLFQTKWTITPEAALLDVTSAESGGNEDQIAGIGKCEIQVEGWYSGNNHYDNPLSIRHGAYLENLALYLNGLASPFWGIPYATVSSVPMIVDVKDLVKYSFRAKVNGAWLYPSGTTAQ